MNASLVVHEALFVGRLSTHVICLRFTLHNERFTGTT
jgi:hypothetical protein